MSFRGGLSKGGGMLNNVDGVITGYLFTGVFPFETKGGAKQLDFSPLYTTLSVRVDGADEDVTQVLMGDVLDGWEISEDGWTLTGDGKIRANGDLGRFLTTLIEPTGGEPGFPEARLPDLEAGDDVNLQAIIGTRVRFVQEDKLDRAGRIKTRKSKKDGKLYPDTRTIVAKVYSVPEVKGKGKNRTAAVATTKPSTTTKSGKPNGAEAADVGDDLDALAEKTLLSILAGRQDGAMKQSRLTVPIIKRFERHDPNREEVQQRLMSEAFVSGLESVAYNKTTQIISLVE